MPQRQAQPDPASLWTPVNSGYDTSAWKPVQDMGTKYAEKPQIDPRTGERIQPKAAGQIDPNTGERIQPQGAIQIDPLTGERITAPAAPAPSPTFTSRLRELVHTGQNEVDDLTRIKPFDSSSFPKMLDTTVGNVGAGLMSPLSLLAHPIASGLALQPHGAGEHIFSALAGPLGMPALRMGQQFAHDPAGTAEQGLGMIASGGLSDLIPRTGDVMQSAGAKVMNRTVGATASDFKRGANPGRAYLEGGGTPAFTMGGLASKGGEVLERAGSKLRDLYDTASKPANWWDPVASPKISSADVTNALLKPISGLRNLLDGPGGIGAPPALDAYTEGLYPALHDAEQSGGFTPRSLFDLKRSVAGNTRWNDPTMFDLNAARQEGVGGLGDLLTQAVPEARMQNKIYQGGLKFRDRTEQRAATGQTPLAQIGRRGLEGVGGAMIMGATHNPFLGLLPLVADSVPAKSAAAYALYQGGRGLSGLPGLRPLVGPGTVAGAIRPRLRDLGAER